MDGKKHNSEGHEAHTKITTVSTHKGLSISVSLGSKEQTELPSSMRS